MVNNVKIVYDIKLDIMTDSVDNPVMAEPMRMVKLSQRNYDRLKKYGFAGESIDTAMGRVLDAVEKKK